MHALSRPQQHVKGRPRLETVGDTRPGRSSRFAGATPTCSPPRSERTSSTVWWRSTSRKPTGCCGNASRPGFLLGNPDWFKRFGGTVGISSVGMFGPAGGWGIPIAPSTLMITVGGIATKPRYLDGQLQPREMLDLTISVDHEVVDGAPAARFARRLAELVEQADGLSAGRQ